MTATMKLLALLPLMLLVAGPTHALENVATQWNEALQRAVAYGVPNQISGRLYGILGLAQLNTIKKGGNAHTSAGKISLCAQHILCPWEMSVARQHAFMCQTKWRCFASCERQTTLDSPHASIESVGSVTKLIKHIPPAAPSPEFQ